MSKSDYDCIRKKLHLESSAFGFKRKVWQILKAMREEDIQELFDYVLEIEMHERGSLLEKI